MTDAAGASSRKKKRQERLSSSEGIVDALRCEAELQKMQKTSSHQRVYEMNPKTRELSDITVKAPRNKIYGFTFAIQK